jgi:hypothetical protein
MCFSTEASFISGALLLPLGIYGTVQALRYNKNYLLFAVMPLIFSAQQLIEGMVWLNLHQHDAYGLYQAALQYTFIAFFLWPMYAPFSIYFIEPDKNRKKIIGFVCIIGFILGTWIYFPLLFGIDKLHVKVINDSITYNIVPYTSLSYLYILLYIFATIFPMFYSSLKEIKIFGILSLASVICAGFMFHYAFTSTWCFFAAVLSIYAVYCLHKFCRSKKTFT